VVATRRDTSAFVHELREFLGVQLPDYMVPAAFMFVPSLPQTPIGKVDRAALPSMEAMKASASFVPPKTTFEKVIAAVWSDLLGQDQIGIDDDFFSIGGHSLLATQVIARVRSNLKIDVPLRQFFDNPTIAGLARIVEDSEPGADSRISLGAARSDVLAGGRHLSPTEIAIVERHPSLLEAIVRAWERENSAPRICLQEGGEGRPLFCVHPGSGSAGAFRQLAKRLGTSRPIHGLQSPGLDGSVEPLTSIEEMAERYVTLIREIQPKGPYLLAGWSTGGLVTLEIAHRFQSEGDNVSLTMLIDTFPPSTEGEGAADADLLFNLFRDTGRVELEELRRRSVSEAVEYVIDRLQIREWVPPDTPSTWFLGHYSVNRTFGRASRRYKPRPYLGRVTLFRPRGDLFGSFDSLDLAWQQWLTSMEICVVPGSHLTMVLEPYAEELAREMRRRMDAVEQGETHAN
jgi:thioesterase domain-containing protein/acyl carrier protein